MGALEPRICVHEWVWVWYFQEHELAPIDTNAYVMGIGNHEKHEKHERGWEYLLLNLMIKLVIFSCVSCVSWLNKKV